MLVQKFKPAILLPLVTGLLLIGLFVSMMLPKKVIDTYKVNVTEEEGDTEVMISLPTGTKLVHSLNTGSRPMLGIQIALSKNGVQYTNSVLKYDVLKKGTDELLSQNVYLLAQGEDLQYIYLPFSDYETCIGDIEIRFQFENHDGTSGSPSILANSSQINGSSTFLNGYQYPGNLKCMYIYTHDTYPLVYDLRILFLLFLAVTMTVSIPANFKKKGDRTYESR